MHILLLLLEPYCVAACYKQEMKEKGVEVIKLHSYSMKIVSIESHRLSLSAEMECPTKA